MAVYERPILSHEPGIIGNYLNLDLEHRYVGTRIGTDLFASVRRNLDQAGLLGRATLYYRNSCAWMRILRKHVLETARKIGYLAGYDWLGAFDENGLRSGYPCGIMNEFFELKPGESAADVLKYNGESVLLLDQTNRRNFSSGDRFQFEILASLYGGSRLAEGKLRWSLSDDRGRIHRRGEWPLREVRNGMIEKLGSVEGALPDLSQPARITLWAQLSGGQYEIGNDWDFWVFPRSGPMGIAATADAAVLARLGSRYRGLRPINAGDRDGVRIVSGIDHDTLDFLSRGGRVLLLGRGPFPALPTSFRMLTTGRVAGNLATVIEDHPLMRRFPHDGYCDWQFYSMLQEGSAVNFTELEAPFAAILEVVSSFKLIRKQASLFEWKVGEGRLLVCTLNLDLTDPAAAYLLDTMLGYVQGDDFKPRQAVDAQTIARLKDGKP